MRTDDDPRCGILEAGLWLFGACLWKMRAEQKVSFSWHACMPYSHREGLTIRHPALKLYAYLHMV